MYSTLNRRTERYRTEQRRARRLFSVNMGETSAKKDYLLCLSVFLWQKNAIAANAVAALRLPLHDPHI